MRRWFPVLFLPALLAGGPVRAEVSPPLAAAFCAGELWTVGERPWLRLTPAMTDDQIIEYSRWAMAFGTAVQQHTRMMAQAAATPDDQIAAAFEAGALVFGPPAELSTAFDARPFHDLILACQDLVMAIFEHAQSQQGQGKIDDALARSARWMREHGIDPT